MDRVFSLLPDARVNEAYAILQLVGKHILQQGRRQRVAKISLQAYRSWQAEQSNYIVTEAGTIVGMVTLRDETLDQWPRYIELGKVPMIRALATDPRHKGKGIGAFAVKECLKLCRARPTVYLDCVSEFLPGYYQQLGFEGIANQTINYSDGETYDITLMAIPFNQGQLFE